MESAPSRSVRACSVGRAIDIVGDARVVLTMRELFFGVRRFSDIQASLDAPRATVAERLTHLVDTGLVARVRYQERPPRDEYRLTAMGRDLYPATVLLMQWGDRWLSSGRAPPLTLTHRTCGHPLIAACTCSSCGLDLLPREVTASPGPGASAVAAGTRTPRRASDPRAFERGRPCSVARALGVVGDRWTFLILREAFSGARRFEAFGSGTGAATNIVAGRLADLVATGVLDRGTAAGTAMPEYRLSEKGLDLYPASLALLAWGDHWLAGDAGPPLLLRHAPCGETFTPTIVCTACRKPVLAADVAFETHYASDAASAVA